MTMAVTTRELAAASSPSTVDRGSQRMAGAYRAVREVLARSRSLTFDQYLQDVLDHAEEFREVAKWMERVQQVAARRPSLAARGLGMSPELARALKLIETAEHGCRLRLVTNTSGTGTDAALAEARDHDHDCDRVADIA